MKDRSNQISLPGSALETARRIASYFALPEPIEAFDFPEKGNINQQTYLISAGSREYLLQQLNPKVFLRPRDVMDAMAACIQAQQKALSRGMLRIDEEWETITLVPTRDGKSYLEESGDEGSLCWRMMVKIPDAYAYKRLGDIKDSHERLRVAEEAGRALAIFGALTAEMDVSRLGCPLPGYRDTRIYYDQLFSVLAGARTILQVESILPADPTTRQSTEQHYLVHLSPEDYRQRIEDPQLRPFIALAHAQKPFGLTLLRELLAGNLKKVVIHGDTKLENFLFSIRTGKAKALVDMDTIMPHTWLSDWGDMLRSLANLSGEKAYNLGEIEIDLNVIKAATRGFLNSARNIPANEIALMADAAPIMALELAVRFLADYLRGDSYFQLGPSDPWDLNKTRAMTQFTVFEKLRAGADSVRRFIQDLRLTIDD
jgi:N-acetylhexosamine 1-kinase